MLQMAMSIHHEEQTHIACVDCLRLMLISPEVDTALLRILMEESGFPIVRAMAGGILALHDRFPVLGWPDELNKLAAHSDLRARKLAKIALDDIHRLA